jgi:hypothetical protein
MSRRLVRDSARDSLRDNIKELLGAQVVLALKILAMNAEREILGHMPSLNCVNAHLFKRGSKAH